MKSFKKSNATKEIKVSKRDSASLAIGDIEKNTDLFILTYGQFSLIDALIAILKKTGPAHVSLSTWTAAHAHLDRSAELMGSGNFLSFRLIVDRSFKTRQPKYFNHMKDIFGANCVREITTHAKFMLIQNDEWNIVVRTSMNLNENPRLENIEISDNKDFACFFKNIVDEIFNEFEPGESSCSTPELAGIKETNNFKLVKGDYININNLNEPEFTHEI